MKRANHLLAISLLITISCSTSPSSSSSNPQEESTDESQVAESQKWLKQFYLYCTSGHYLEAEWDEYKETYVLGSNSTFPHKLQNDAIFIIENGFLRIKDKNLGIDHQSNLIEHDNQFSFQFPEFQVWTDDFEVLIFNFETKVVHHYKGPYVKSTGSYKRSRLGVYQSLDIKIRNQGRYTQY